MKKSLFIIFCILSGCAYTQTTITADNGSTVKCTSTVDKPVDLSSAIKGNVPLQGGTVNDAGDNTAN
jgi:hypothetical protein